MAGIGERRADMTIEFGNKPTMQTEGSEPVIENPKLPMMGDKPAREPRAKAGLKLMEEKPKPVKGGKNLMAAPPLRKAGLTAAAKPPGDQQEKKARPAKGKPESYLRMRVRVENGAMSVVSMKDVEGPLTMRDSLPGGFAYEVSLDQKQIAVGTVPDIGVWRGLPDPKGAKGMEGHHITTQESVEFNVRVPREELSLAALPKTEIVLYQVKKDVSDQPIASRMFATAFSEELREVARLKGIKLADLSESAQKEAKRAFK
jgi:hypothetical protein